MKGYYIFSAFAFALFFLAQYNGYSPFDSVATARTTGHTGTHAIFHK